MSRGFICALFGVAMTVFAWFAPWEWPGWPALAVIALLTRARMTPDKTAIAAFIVIMTLNMVVWAAAAYAASLSLRWIRKERL